jgi:hypothetical protein
MIQNPGSGIRIPDPGIRIPESGFRIPEFGLSLKKYFKLFGDDGPPGVAQITEITQIIKISYIKTIIATFILNHSGDMYTQVTFARDRGSGRVAMYHRVMRRVKVRPVRYRRWTSDHYEPILNKLNEFSSAGLVWLPTQ